MFVLAAAHAFSRITAKAEGRKLLTAGGAVIIDLTMKRQLEQSAGDGTVLPCSLLMPDLCHDWSQ